ncbi:Uncharacterised protein [uncultured archaeon]|nr:Uncharacterised protein [uncultured archaeon]
MVRASTIIVSAAVFMFSVFISSPQPLPAAFLASQNPANQTGYSQGSLSIPAQFSGDWYEVSGGPDLQVSLARSSVYRNENSSLELTVTNVGRVTSFKVLTQPEPSRPEEILAAQKELQLEALRSTAQDVSIRLLAQNSSAMDIKREVAYAGSLRDGQVSSVLQYPVEVYENTEPGFYTLYAIANYTYQQDVAVKPHSDSPENPDVFYWYNSASQTIPITLHVEKRSKVDLKALSAVPGSLIIGSKNNIVKVAIQNQGTDTAKDLVARLRPETGIYVDMDESPIPTLGPGEKAELVYKVDVSKDAVGGRPYRFTLLFDFSDTYRKNLQDSDHVYITLQLGIADMILAYWWVAVIVGIVGLAVVFRMRRKPAPQANEHTREGAQ